MTRAAEPVPSGKLKLVPAMITFKADMEMVRDRPYPGNESGRKHRFRSVALTRTGASKE